MGNIMKTRACPALEHQGNGPVWRKCIIRMDHPLFDCMILCLSQKLKEPGNFANQACLLSPRVYIQRTGPNEVKVLEDELRPESLTGENYLLASFEQARCIRCESNQAPGRSCTSPFRCRLNNCSGS